tara:strand:- start:383 stop:580 length:198 start_codon:yes stop_codon:yes gene_type:complete
MGEISLLQWLIVILIIAASIEIIKWFSAENDKLNDIIIKEEREEQVQMSQSVELGRTKDGRKTSD